MMVLVLENIRSALNVGSLFRSADAFGVTEIICVGYTPTPDDAALQKTALGAELAVPWKSVPTVRDAVKNLKAQGFAIIALEITPEAVPLNEFSATKPVALILGNEVDGVSAEALQLCDQAVTIPMSGSKESLNVSVAGAIAMFAILSV